MDLDAALARQLQAEEQLSASRAGQAAGHQPSAEQHFAGRLQSSLKTALQYEDELLQAIAQSVMPLERMTRSAEDTATLSAALGERPVRQVQDLLAQELLTWFKHDFFMWVNSPACSKCGGHEMHASGMGVPSAEERAGDAGRVELHTCNTCHCVTRFPRYNSPAKLLETRQGRCGEWANCFTLCCRAAGLEARYIADWTDHVWTEYYSHAHKRWIHLDPCEAAYDQPLLYEAGWGKELSYVVGFSRHGVTDIMKRYTKQWDQLKQRRNQVSEDWLSQQCRNLTASCRREWTAEEQAVWEQRDRQEQAELAAHANAATTPQEHSLPGRQTGSEGWRAARGELGTQSSSRGSDAGTAYKVAHDGHVQSSHPNRLCEGVVRASGEHVPHQTALKAFDEALDSKWLDFGGANGGITWLEYRLLPSQPAVSLASYCLTSAEDEPSRDPCDFVLEGSLEITAHPGGPAWRQLDKQQGVNFQDRHQTRTFTLLHPLPCRAFRLRITAVKQPASANSVQLAKLDLYTTPAAQSSHPLGIAEAVSGLQTVIAAAQAEQSQHAALQTAVSTLLLVLSNIAQRPDDQKFRTLRLGNQKIQDMFSTAAGPQLRAVLEAIGFKQVTRLRQQKEDPEDSLILDSSSAVTAVLHALALLQRPMATEQSQAQSPSNETQQQPSTSQQQAITDTAAATTEQASQHAQSSASMSLLGDAVKTNDTAPAAVTAVDSSAPAAAIASIPQLDKAPVSDTPAAQQKVQRSGLSAQSTSGTAQQRSTDATPVQAQAYQDTPAAPQRQHKPKDFTSVVTPMERLQLQTPSAAAEVAAPTGSAEQSTGSIAQTKGMAVKPVDVKTLIQQEFGRLMATKQYTPNQAAMLAVQKLSKR